VFFNCSASVPAHAATKWISLPSTGTRASDECGCLLKAATRVPYPVDADCSSYCSGDGATDATSGILSET
jgi:hypothetical protein